MSTLVRTILLVGVLTLLLPVNGPTATASDQIRITVDHVQPGAPITVGLPFPKGELQSPEHMRVLTSDGTPIPSQITPVTSWAPADSSLKWVWVFFFATDGDSYQLEYGPNVQRAPIMGDRLRVKNNQRPYGHTEITTGPLRLRIEKGSGGSFLEEVFFDAEGDGFEADDRMATEPDGRGSYLDLLDAAGLDSSRATVTQTYKEKGSGPLHAILRIEGTYHYSRDDNNSAPFVTRIHAYAGKPYLRVLHTLTYTGDPDQHPPLDGQHAQIATSAENVVNEDSLAGDPRWTIPNDRIAAAGLSLDYDLSGPLTVRTSYQQGTWWAPDEPQIYERPISAENEFSLIQTGPDSASVPTGPNSSPTERIDDFSARILSDDTEQVDATRAAGWIDVVGDERGVGVGIRHFTEAYPKEITLSIDSQRVDAELWSGSARPMSFARWSSEEDGGMVGNFAQGLTKTTEYVYRFHEAETDLADVRRSLNYVLDPAVAHAPPSWYTKSRVYGRMAPHSDEYATFERGMDYKFRWWRFNQQWEPWYGAFTYGDGKNYYFGGTWYEYSNNEPAEDFMWWQQFMRTGERKYALTGQAMSRHTMDVDNTHWPAGTDYRGDTNSALDWWHAKADTTGSPYVGMGRRHGNQHWTAMLSAHVWVAGWLASYYLDGYHRGLEVAEKTGDYYRRRIFGKHGLTGRRLYLSVWNLVELYDATKDPQIREELDARVNRMLQLQREQGGSLIIDRYGYAQVYVAQGLGKYYQLTGDSAVRDALIRHARWVRDNPPLNHEMESYLSSISTLLKGYQLSGDDSLYRTAYDRAQALRTDSLTLSMTDTTSQQTFFEALNAVDRLPRSREHPDRRPIWSLTNGLRIFGWTHAYNVPSLMYWLERKAPPK
ncbi:hypothetical protein BSZ35_07170 [Salinibacter sp. 10B]|uniref:exo-rhamnogalacturonan lyase family protein n=1 Tax=Salinibacter sp. 10B TaxID=1923971 RepID=UPI000D2DEC99|nr:hypothetical protein [Salinibacter sp. 10B]PQJ34409.1 hypothetical protein BSZ35_07170 [Salinibacter sp. 10B]